eukprot:ANDGO_05646.mRNA.1 hypothetical protein
MEDGETQVSFIVSDFVMQTENQLQCSGSVQTEERISRSGHTQTTHAETMSIPVQTVHSETANQDVQVECESSNAICQAGFAAFELQTIASQTSTAEMTVDQHCQIASELQEAASQNCGPDMRDTGVSVMCEMLEMFMQTSMDVQHADAQCSVMTCEASCDPCLARMVNSSTQVCCEALDRGTQAECEMEDSGLQYSPETHEIATGSDEACCRMNNGCQVSAQDEDAECQVNILPIVSDADCQSETYQMHSMNSQTAVSHFSMADGSTQYETGMAQDVNEADDELSRTVYLVIRSDSETQTDTTALNAFPPLHGSLPLDSSVGILSSSTHSSVIHNPLSSVGAAADVFTPMSDRHRTIGMDDLGEASTSPESVFSVRSDLSERSSPQLKAGLQFYKTRQQELEANRAKIMCTLKDTIRENDELKKEVEKLKIRLAFLEAKRSPSLAYGNHNYCHHSSNNSSNLSMANASVIDTSFVLPSDLSMSMLQSPPIASRREMDQRADIMMQTIQQLQQTISHLEQELASRNAVFIEKEAQLLRVRDRDDVIARENRSLKEKVDKMESDKAHDVKRIQELQRQVAAIVNKVEMLTNSLEEVSRDRESILAKSRTVEAETEREKAVRLEILQKVESLEVENNHLKAMVEQHQVERQQLIHHAQQNLVMDENLVEFARNSKKSIKIYQDLKDQIRVLSEENQRLKAQAHHLRENHRKKSLEEKENGAVALQAKRAVASVASAFAPATNTTAAPAAAIPLASVPVHPATTTSRANAAPPPPLPRVPRGAPISTHHITTSSRRI